MSTEPKFKIIHAGGLSPHGQVVFLHGLMGDRRTTWESSPAEGCFWPAWLKDPLPDIAVCTVGYDASATGWGGSARGLIDRAQTIAALLFGQRRDELPTIFVCHSLGGLVAKEMLFQSATNPSRENAWVKDMTKGVAFLGTPHAGSRLADFALAMGWASRSSAVTEDLQTDSAYLERLGSWYARETPALGIRTIAFSETKDTEIKRRLLKRIFKARVVTRESANPRVAGVNPTDIETDHIEIAKPVTRDSIVYSNVCRFVEDLLVPAKLGVKDKARSSPPVDEPPPSNNSLNAAFEDAEQRALDYYRDQIVLKLQESPAALDALTTSGPSTKAEVKVRAGALATQLLSMTVDDAQDLLAQAHQRLWPTQRRAATVCFDIARLLLPAVYDPKAIRDVRDQMAVEGAYIVEVQARLDVVADLILAAATGRELMIKPPSEDGRWPEDAYLKLDLPPNIGRGGLEAYLAAWDEYLWTRFGLDGDETSDRAKFVDDELAHRALKRKPPEIYYVLLPKDRERRGALELAIERLKTKYHHLMIVGLAVDSDGVNREAGRFRSLRDMAYREGRKR